ncbi:MAG: hypothetical protein RIS52_2037 [Pseudomonadota bacterium]|jgi:hypothetical protein
MISRVIPVEPGTQSLLQEWGEDTKCLARLGSGSRRGVEGDLPWT